MEIPYLAESRGRWLASVRRRATCRPVELVAICPNLSRPGDLGVAATIARPGRGLERRVFACAGPAPADLAATLRAIADWVEAPL